MKRATAVRHLREMCEVASESRTLRDTPLDWPLEALWVAGELLEDRVDLEFATVVLSLQLPAEELPWRADHRSAGWIAESLRLGKRPFFYWYRPACWPAWGAGHQQVVRIWSAGAGEEPGVLAALAEPRFCELPIVEPSRDRLAEQLSEELALSRRHLRVVLDGYWERAWQGEHHFGEGPVDHLWRAAEGVREIEDVLASLQEPHI